MPKKQLLYVAYDTGPSNYGLDIITGAQRKKNWGVQYLGNNPSISVYTFRELRESYWDYAIVGGPSSFENAMDKEVLFMGKDEGKQVYILADSPGSILRPGVRGYVDNAIAIVASPSDIARAKEFGYKDAVWLEGYPSHWGSDPTKVKHSDIFTRGDYPDASVRIFVCGLKHAEITDHMLESVVCAVSEHDDEFRIYFQAHPSEIEGTKNALRRNRLVSDPRVSELKSRENIASVMMAADCTVLSGGATGILEGALLRLPVVYYLDNQVKEYMKQQTNEEVWGPVVAGACVVAGYNSMPDILGSLLNMGGHDDMARVMLREKQEAAFPHEPAGLNIVQEVLDYIENPDVYVPFSQRQHK